MRVSRFTWYWVYTLIVATVGLVGFKLADDLGSTILAILILVGSIVGILIMTVFYRIG